MKTHLVPPIGVIFFIEGRLLGLPMLVVVDLLEILCANFLLKRSAFQFSNRLYWISDIREHY
jgi:CRISPR/Cas system-associated exonuclease Cas4 (RecB family)